MNNESKSGVLKFKVSSFRKIPNPYLTSKNEGEKKPEMYELICDVLDVPDSIPMGTNPREQKLNTSVAKKIQASLTNHVDLNFYLLNRGLLLSAESILYDNVANECTITFSDPEVHGNVDGGHTYKIILQNRYLLERGEQYIKIEVLTGVEDFFEDLAEARNKSVQVQDKSMEELREHFDLIKNALENEPFFDDISYKENDAKRIDVLDILALMNMFNIDRYPVNIKSNKSYPINSYSGKATCLNIYIKSYKEFESDQTQNPYYKMSKILPTICKLYDEIERRIGDFYNKSVTGGGKYGLVAGVATHKCGPDFKTKFYQESKQYLSPNGFIYPIIGAFRALVYEKDGMYEWKKDPFETLEECGIDLASSTVEVSRRKGNNPNATGKDPMLWSNLFMCVMFSTFEN